jgi:cysteine desulfurase family protein (TIGR01976 family)
MFSPEVPGTAPAVRPDLSSRGDLDLAFVRSRFPALAGEWIFLDNAGGSQVLSAVADRVREYLLSSSVQLGASYDVSRLAAERVAEGARAAATLVNGDPGEIVLGSSTTQLLQNLARAMAEELQPGDEIVVTNSDHEANVTPWVRLEERDVTIRCWRVRPDTLRLHVEDLERLLTDRTRLVCFPHVSNILGTINPVAEITRLAHQRGVRVCVDGVAFAPHRAVDVRAWDVDFYVFSLYKVFGPHMALLWGRRELLLELANVNHVFIARDAIPYKLQPGSISYELAWGIPAIVDYLRELGERIDPAAGSVRAALEGAFGAIAVHEERLAAVLLDYLSRQRKVRLLGDPAADRQRRIATISFAVEGRNASEIPLRLDAHKIGIRFGDFHSRRLIQDLGLATRQGVVRISMAHYNTVAEMETLVERLDQILL